MVGVLNILIIILFSTSTLYSLNPAEQSYTSACNKNGNSREVGFLISTVNVHKFENITIVVIGF